MLSIHRYDHHYQSQWRSWNTWRYLRLNLDVSLSKNERLRPAPPLTDDTSLLSEGTVYVPGLAGAAIVRRSFTVLPEIVVRYAMPRLKLTLLPAAAACDVGERTVTPVRVDASSDGLQPQSQYYLDLHSDTAGQRHRHGNQLNTDTQRAVITLHGMDKLKNSFMWSCGRRSALAWLHVSKQTCRQMQTLYK